MKFKLKVSLISFLLLVLFVIAAFFISSRRIVSEKEMTNYVLEFQNNYNYLSDHILPVGVSETVLKREYKYNIMISKQKGALVEFLNVDNKERINYFKTDLSIDEFYFIKYNPLVFNSKDILERCAGGLKGDIDNWDISNNIMPQGCFSLNNVEQGLLMNNAIGFFSLGQNVTLFAVNTTFNSELVPFLIIKSYNAKDYWTEQMAIDDSTGFFWATLPSQFLETEEFRKYMAVPELKKFCEEIVSKEENGVYEDDPILAEKDMRQLALIAGNYNLSGEFAKNILESEQKKTDRTDAKKRQFNDLLMSILIGFCLWLITLYPTFIVMRKLEKKHPKN